MDAYDVIIIGTGAGGGTLARHLAPSGKRILLLERGDWLPREPENWLAQDVFVDNRYVSPDTWYDEQRQAVPAAVHYFVGGATKLYGAALYRLRKEDFGELRHHDGISPAWPISVRRPRAVLHAGGAACTRCTAPAARIRPSRRRAARIPFPPVVARAAHPAALGRPRGRGPPPVPRALRDPARRGQPGLQRVHPLQPLRRLPLPRAREVRRGGARRAARARAPERHAADEREGDEARDQRGRTAVTEVVVDHDGAEERYRGRRRRRRVRRGEHGEVLLLRSANDAHPNGLANGSDQVGRNYMFHDSTAVLALSRDENPTTYQKTLGAERLLLRRRRLRATRSGTSRWSASRRRRCSAARGRARRSSRPSGRSSASPSTRSTSGSRPRTCRCPTTG